MPESVSLPTVLRRRLSPFEQSVLTLGAQGGAQLVADHADGVANLNDAVERLSAVRKKAASILGSESNGGGRARVGVKAGIEASCPRHGLFVERGHGCPACDPSQGGGARARPGAARREREVVRPLEEALLEAAGVEAAPVSSERDGTLPGDAADRPDAPEGAPPLAEPSASSEVFAPAAVDPPGPESVPEPEREVLVAPERAVQRSAEELRREREKILALLCEGPKSVAYLAELLDRDPTALRGRLETFAKEGVAASTGRYVRDRPGAESRRGRGSAEWVILPDGLAEVPVDAEPTASVEPSEPEIVREPEPEPEPDGAARSEWWSVEMWRECYLSALLTLVEEGEHSPELLDRFERVAGIA